MEKIWILLLPLLGMLRFVPPFTELADEPGPGGAGGYLLEDGSSYLLMESGDYYLLES